jgi:hypothetical protein
MTERRSRTIRVAAWASFWLSVAAAWVLGEYGWALESWMTAQIAAGAATATLAIWALANAEYRRGAIAIAIVGIAIGNWRLVEGAAMITFWSTRGFAP